MIVPKITQWSWYPVKKFFLLSVCSENRKWWAANVYRQKHLTQYYGVKGLPIIKRSVFRIESCMWEGVCIGECLWQIGAITKDGCHGDDWDQERPPTPRGLAKGNAQRRLRKCHSSSVISGPGQTNPLSIIIPSAVTSQNKLTLLMFSVTFVTLLLRGDSRGLMAIRPVLFVS